MAIADPGILLFVNFLESIVEKYITIPTTSKATTNPFLTNKVVI